MSQQDTESRSQIAFYGTDALKEQVAQAAAANGRSVSKEIEARLNLTVEMFGTDADVLKIDVQALDLPEKVAEFQAIARDCIAGAMSKALNLPHNAFFTDYDVATREGWVGEMRAQFHNSVEGLKVAGWLAEDTAREWSAMFRTEKYSGLAESVINYMTAMRGKHSNYHAVTDPEEKASLDYKSGFIFATVHSIIGAVSTTAYYVAEREAVRSFYRNAKNGIEAATDTLAESLFNAAIFLAEYQKPKVRNKRDGTKEVLSFEVSHPQIKPLTK